MSEKELASKLISWLTEQHWEVYQEVPMGAIADIVAVRNKIVWIIECKTSMTFTVLEQAQNWHTHYRSVAIPEAQRRSGRQFANSIAQSLGIGVIEIGMYIKVIEPAPLHREWHKSSMKILKNLREEHKTFCAAGSANDRRFTPYVATITDVKYFIGRHPGCTIKEIMSSLHHHYSSDQSAKTCLRVALSSWESDWCKIETVGKENRYYIKQSK